MCKRRFSDKIFAFEWLDTTKLISVPQGVQQWVCDL